MSELDKLFSDMEGTTWNHSGDREAANVGYVVTTEKTFQGAKLEAAKLREEIEELRQMLVDRKIYSMAPEILSPPSEAGQ